MSDLVAILDLQGALVLEMELPQTVSGFTFRPDGTTAFAVHAGEAAVRRRFSLAHEYSHALCDLGSGGERIARDGRAIVSRTGESAELGEVRANAFAAAFLLPEDGLRSFLGQLGKGSPTRPAGTVFTENGPQDYVLAEGRLAPRSQDIGAWETAQIADYFMVSRECAIWRLSNLRYLTETERDQVLAAARGDTKGKNAVLAGAVLLAGDPAGGGWSRFRELAGRAGAGADAVTAPIADTTG